MKRSSLIFLAIIILLYAAPSPAYFQDPGAGARPLGMGGAYVAAADDCNSLFWNPAGLTRIHKQEFIATFSSLYTGLNAKLYNSEFDRLGYHFIGYVYPSRMGSFGTGWNTLQSHFYDESTLCLSYGGELRERLCIGLNLKRLSWKMQGNEYTRMDKDIPDDGASQSGFTLDLGALFKANNNLSFGFSAENLIPADVGLNTENQVPVNSRAGIAYRAYNPKNLNLELLYVMEITYRDEASIRMGAEGWFLDKILGVRAGWNPTSATMGLSYRLVKNLLEMQLDYAFIYPLYIRETYGSHRISVIFRF
jgi:hypothetical protein